MAAPRKQSTALDPDFLAFVVALARRAADDDHDRAVARIEQDAAACKGL